MLKFLRKYQLYIMIVGGSLLMVVFLLQPVLTRLAPTTAKKTVATVGPEKQKISGMDREIANANFGAVRNIVPVLFSPYFIALDPQSPGDHWLLLTREAKANGLIGEAGDGKNWESQIALIMAQAEAREAMRQQFGNVSGLSSNIIDMLLNQPQAQQDIANRAVQIENQLPSYISKATASNPFLKTIDDTYRALAQARGILRLLALHRNAARRSIPEATAVLSEALDGVAVDLLILTPDLIADSIPDPTEEQLQAHFDRFKDLAEKDSEFSIGYVLPPRIKLEYLKLDAQAIAQAVQVDRVEISKRFRKSPDLYGDSLNAETTPGSGVSVAKQIENQIRSEITESVMINADRNIRSILLTATRNLAKHSDGTLKVPDGWTAPTLESIAQSVAESVTLPNGDPIPLPTVVRHASSWLTSPDVAALPDFGTASYRVGTTGFKAEALPFVIAQYLNDGYLNELLPVQVGIPFVSNAATDAQSNRYYINIIEARKESPAQSIDEAGREKVTSDYTSIKAYETLLTAAEGYLDIARASDLEGLASQFSETTPPQVAQNIIIRKEQRSTESMPPWATPANTQDARDTVLATARERLTPLQSPEEITPLNAYLSVQLPSARSLAIFKLIARRPLTAEQSLLQGFSIIQAKSNAELIDVEDFQTKFPYSFEAMKRRHQFKLIKKKNSDSQSATQTQPTDESEQDDSQDAQPAASD